MKMTNIALGIALQAVLIYSAVLATPPPPSCPDCYSGTYPNCVYLCSGCTACQNNSCVSSCTGDQICCDTTCTDPCDAPEDGSCSPAETVGDCNDCNIYSFFSSCGYQTVKHGGGVADACTGGCDGDCEDDVKICSTKYYCELKYDPPLSFKVCFEDDFSEWYCISSSSNDSCAECESSIGNPSANKVNNTMATKKCKE